VAVVLFLSHTTGLPSAGPLPTFTFPMENLIAYATNHFARHGINFELLQSDYSGSTFLIGRKVYRFTGEPVMAISYAMLCI
jgi:hypothetical protein